MFSSYQMYCRVVVISVSCFILPSEALNLSGLSFMYYENNSVVASLTVTPPSALPSFPWFFSWRYNGEQIATAGILRSLRTFTTPGPDHPYSNRTLVTNHPKSVAGVVGYTFTSELRIESLSLADVGLMVTAFVNNRLSVSNSLDISECSNGTYTISSQSAYPCLTGCRADLSLFCPPGVAKSSSGICQLDGTFLPAFSCVSQPTGTSSIETVPLLPDNVIATGYPGLVIKSKLQKRDIKICVWIYGGELDWSQFYVAGFGGCFPRMGQSANISCVEQTIDGVVFVLSDLTLFRPIPDLIIRVLNVVVRCDNGFLIPLPKIKVRDCPFSFSNSVVVVSSSNSYGSSGTYACLNKQLSYSDGSAPATRDTTCSVSAKWTGQDGLECWAAPAVNLTGNLTAKEGGSLDLHCNYDEVIPYGNYTLFNVGNLGIHLPKTQPLMLVSLRPTDNKKVVFCQALTGYTEEYSTGKSSNFTLNVLNKPYSDLMTTCNWTVSQSHWCNVTVWAHPLAEYVDIVKAGLQTHRFSKQGPTIISNVDERQTFHFVMNDVRVSDRGFYDLVLRSSQFEGVHRILFEVVVFEHSFFDVSFLFGQSATFLTLLFLSIIFFLVTVALFVEKIRASPTSGTDQPVQKREAKSVIFADVNKEVHSQYNTMKDFVFDRFKNKKNSPQRPVAKSKSVTFAIPDNNSSRHQFYSRDDISTRYGSCNSYMEEDRSPSLPTKKLFAGPLA